MPTLSAVQERSRDTARSIAYDHLASRRLGQREAFAVLRNQFASRYASLREHDVRQKPFTTPAWETMWARMEANLLPAPQPSFLNAAPILVTMTGVMRQQDIDNTLALVSSYFHRERLEELLLEDWPGEPPYLLLPWFSSHGQLAMLGWLVRFFRRAHCTPGKIGPVVEWGGGYGMLAKIFRRLGLPNSTYVIVDSAFMSCVQWLYLSTIFGVGEVHQIDSTDSSLREGKINLLPLCHLDSHRDLRADLFVSMRALEESSSFAIDFVLASGWFGAKRHIFNFCVNPHLYHAEKFPSDLAARGIHLDMRPGPEGPEYWAFSEAR